MRYEHVPRRRGNIHMLHGAAERVGIALDDCVRIKAADVRGLDEREQIKPHLAIGVRDRHRLHAPIIDRREMHAARRHKPRAERDALRRIVVAGDGEHRNVPPGQLGKKRIEKLDRLGARHGAVVNIARDHDRVGALLVRPAEDLFENVFLVIDQGKLIDTSPEMEIGQMKEFQAIPPTFQPFSRFSARMRKRTKRLRLIFSRSLLLYRMNQISCHVASMICWCPEERNTLEMQTIA